MVRHVSVQSSWDCFPVCLVKGIIPIFLNVTDVKAGSKLEATSGILNGFVVSDVIFPQASIIDIKPNLFSFDFI